MIRRLIGAFLGASLLHLSVGRANVACDPQAQGQPAGEHAQHLSAPATALHGSHADTDAPAVSDEGCQSPAQADCCHALMQCSVVMMVGAAQATDGNVRSRDIAAVSVQREPYSRIRTPEPPPPRA